MRKLQRGQKASLSHHTINKMLESTESSNNVSRGSANYQRRENCVCVYNNTSGILQRYDVVSLGEPRITPSGNLEEFTYNLTLNAEIPDANKRYAAICVEPIPISGYGLACVDGVAPAYINHVDSKYRYADCVKDHTYFQSSNVGVAQILWLEKGIAATGLQYGVVRFGGIPAAENAEKTGRLASNLLPRSSGLVNVYEPTSSGMHFSGEKLYAFDWMLPNGSFISAGKNCVVQNILNRWFVTTVEPSC